MAGFDYPAKDIELTGSVDIADGDVIGISDGTNTASVNSAYGLEVSSMSEKELLEAILKEMRVMNVHLSLITDERIHSDTDLV
jgi:hypothetical protein